VTGTLDRRDKMTQFTGFDLVARLEVPDGVDPGTATQALERAERNCLVSNSLKGAVHLHPTVQLESAFEPAFG
jgi:organic hydroperoxide reductase OsmC/OhrA